MQLPNGLITFGPKANCTLEICPVKYSILQYQPSIPANAFFAAMFGLTMLIHLYQGIRGRTYGFATSMACGCILEILGYIGRIMLHNNPFTFIGFLLQISMLSARMALSLGRDQLTVCSVCITIAPVFFCSAIYVLLSRV